MDKLLILMVFFAALFIYNYMQISRFFVSKPVFYSSKLNKEIRITQISDYHSNSLINKDELLKEIESFNPHIIALTGDIIDKRTNDMDSAIDLVNRLYNINPNVFFVIGNHELNNIQGHRFISKIKEIGVTLLDNESKVLELDQERINIVGLSFPADKEDYEKAMEDVNYRNYTLVLSHSPDKLVTFISGKEDLILSGHTHGGQIRIPLIGAVIGHEQGLFPKYDKGIFKLNHAILYIDSGLGNSFLPIRLFNRVQISNIAVKSVEID
ncbi:MAG: metallophosphoesterase [Tissierellales bacterium]